MKKLLASVPVLLLSFYSYQGQAQYCNPSEPNTSGIFISRAGFENISGIAHTSASEGYSNWSAASSGVVNRGCDGRFNFTLQSCGNQGNKNYDFRIYADWNQDNDFDDAGELFIEASGVINSGNCAEIASSRQARVPITANSGAIRLRWTVSEGGVNAVPCGGYTGEIEDFTITVNTNSAPVLNNIGEAKMNALVETQTNNQGVSLNMLMTTSTTGGHPISKFTDSDPCQANYPGIAVTGTTGNGTWQYAGQNGSWHNMGSISSSNALLLDVSASRIRFQPAGPGAVSISYRAWDKTAGAENTYGNASSPGGASAFSAAEETINTQVYSASSASADIPMYMVPFSGMRSTLARTSFSPSTGVFKQIDELSPVDDWDAHGTDMELDAVNSRLYWTGGYSQFAVYSCKLDGTDRQEIFSYLDYPAGIAIGDDKLFISTYEGIYKSNLDGSNAELIMGGPGQASASGFQPGDIVFNNNKIYYQNRNKIVETNTDGTGTMELITASYPSRAIQKIDVFDGKIYWIEYDNDDAYIQTRAISGGPVTTLVAESLRFFVSLRADPAHNKVYFSDELYMGGDFRLRSAPLDGSNVVTDELYLESDYNAILFARSIIALPVDFTGVKAWADGTPNKVAWTVANQENLSHYIIERSSDAREFVEIGRVNATQNNSYQFTDANPLAGKNYYRVRSVDIDGKKLQSATVQVDRNSKDRSIAIFPTQVVNAQVTLRLQNVASGNYQLQLFSNSGQQLFTQTIRHTGGSGVQPVTLPAGLPKGLYRIVVTGGEDRISGSIIVQ